MISARIRKDCRENSLLLLNLLPPCSSHGMKQVWILHFNSHFVFYRPGNVKKEHPLERSFFMSQFVRELAPTGSMCCCIWHLHRGGGISLQSSPRRWPPFSRNTGISWAGRACASRCWGEWKVLHGFGGVLLHTQHRQLQKERKRPREHETDWSTRGSVVASERYPQRRRCTICSASLHVYYEKGNLKNTFNIS